MVGYEGKLLSHEKACALFRIACGERVPISGSTVNTIVARYQETEGLKSYLNITQDY